MIITDEQKNTLFEVAYYYRKEWLSALKGNSKLGGIRAYERRMAFLEVINLFGLSDEYTLYELNHLTEGNNDARR